MKGIKTTNPVAVGDHVSFESSADDKEGIITSIKERKNYIIRKSSNLSKESQILAANIDQALLIATVAYPKTHTEFIDRFLITAEAYNIPALLVFNKLDLYDEEQRDILAEWMDIYENIGYRCLVTSVTKKIHKEELKKNLKDKISLIAGNSGVGKSSLVNMLDPALQLKTNEISDYHQAGKHTTTFAEMHPLSFGGYIIDTPGIKGFGLIDMDKEELYHFFPEIFKISGNCQFYNCSHVHEPKCAVKKAVEEGTISYSRYQNYLNILHDNEEKYRV